jgi:hypothetical protein
MTYTSRQRFNILRSSARLWSRRGCTCKDCIIFSAVHHSHLSQSGSFDRRPFQGLFSTLSFRGDIQAESEERASRSCRCSASEASILCSQCTVMKFANEANSSQKSQTISKRDCSPFIPVLTPAVTDTIPVSNKYHFTYLCHRFIYIPLYIYVSSLRIHTIFTYIYPRFVYIPLHI